MALYSIVFPCASNYMIDFASTASSWTELYQWSMPLEMMMKTLGLMAGGMVEALIEEAEIGLLKEVTMAGALQVPIVETGTAQTMVMGPSR